MHIQQPLRTVIRYDNDRVIDRMPGTAERGLDFTLGIWMQAPVPSYSGRVLVEIAKRAGALLRRQEPAPLPPPPRPL